MNRRHEIILSTVSGWKISPEVWMEWLVENRLKRIDFYGHRPAFAPFFYKEDNLESWRKAFEKRDIRVFSYTPEMQNYPLNLADVNEEVRLQSVQYCKNAICGAAILGAEYVRIQTGYFYLGKDRHFAFGQIEKSLEVLLREAEQKKICILTGPDDGDVTNVIDGCEKTAALFEKFPGRYMKVLLPISFITEKGENSAWYENLLGERMGALAASAEGENVKTVMEKTISDGRLLSALPVILELSGQNRVDRYLSSVKEGFEAAGRENGGEEEL